MMLIDSIINSASMLVSSFTEQLMGRSGCKCRPFKTILFPRLPDDDDDDEHFFHTISPVDTDEH